MSARQPPTCYIHIGPHKTGSSSLKHFMRANEATLETLGLSFPKTILENGKRARNHQPLGRVEEIMPDGGLTPGAKLWTEIDEIARGGTNDILISSEGFASDLAVSERFDPVLTFFERRGYSVVILAYVRDQPTWLNSWFVQSQKRLSRPETFDAFVEEWVKAGRVEPQRYLAPFLDNPRLKVEIIPFERAAASGLEDDFIRRCGVEDPSALIKAPIRNTNAGAKTVFAARRIMSRLGGGMRDHEAYARIYRDFKLLTRELGWDGQPYIGLDQEKYDRIRARFASSNDVFARAHFGVSWEELCPRRLVRPSMFDPETSTPEALEQIEAVVERFVKDFKEGRGGKRKKRNAG